MEQVLSRKNALRSAVYRDQETAPHWRSNDCSSPYVDIGTETVRIHGGVTCTVGQGDNRSCRVTLRI
jgi:hypothetical protein